MSENTTRAIEVLNNSGILAKNGTEVELLTLFRKLPDDRIRDKQLARISGFVEAYEDKERGAIHA